MKNVLKVFALFSILFASSSIIAEVNVVSWGGAYTESQKKGYGDPYMELSGVQVNWIDYSGGLGEVRTQVESGAVTWNIVDVYAKDTITGCDEGLFVEFDFDNDFPPAPDGTPASEDFFTDMPSDCAVGNILYSWDYGYNTEVFPDGPTTIEDFFDTAAFPGKRGVYHSAMTNLEIALVADGVEASQVYNVLENQTGAVDRAIDKIAALCADPNGGCVFWSAGSQPPELLMSGEVVMATGWNGRFFNATIGEGAPIVQVWDGQGLDYEYFALVKGGPGDADGSAMKVLREMTSTEGLAGSAKYIAYAPWRKSSIAIMEAGEPWFKDGKTNMVPHMPTAPGNLKTHILMNPDFWADNQDEIAEKWEAMKAGL